MSDAVPDRVASLANPILRRALLADPHLSMLAGPDPALTEQLGIFPGYYLRTPEGESWWIGSDVRAARANVGEACNRFLSRQFGWQYDVEFSHGTEASGASPWSNVSATDMVVP